MGRGHTNTLTRALNDHDISEYTFERPCLDDDDKSFTFAFERPTERDPELAKEFAERGASRTFVVAIGGEEALRYMPVMNEPHSGGHSSLLLQILLSIFTL